MLPNATSIPDYIIGISMCVLLIAVVSAVVNAAEVVHLRQQNQRLEMQCETMTKYQLELLAERATLAYSMHLIEQQCEQCLITLELINDLRQREGWVIELICDNPDFDNGPNSIVDVFGEWRNLEGMWEWVARRFTGDTMHACLAAAKAERDRQMDPADRISETEPRSDG